MEFRKFWAEFRIPTLLQGGSLCLVSLVKKIRMIKFELNQG